MKEFIIGDVHIISFDDGTMKIANGLDFTDVVNGHNIIKSLYQVLAYDYERVKFRDKYQDKGGVKWIKLNDEWSIGLGYIGSNLNDLANWRIAFNKNRDRINDFVASTKDKNDDLLIKKLRGIIE